MTGKQSHGLMTHRSDRHEEQGINLVGQRVIRELWCQLFLYSPGRVYTTHEGEGMLSQRSDDAFCHQLA